MQNGILVSSIYNGCLFAPYDATRTVQGIYPWCSGVKTYCLYYCVINYTPTLGLLSEYRIELFLLERPCIVATFPTTCRIVCRGVSSFVTGCPCSICDRTLTHFPMHVCQFMGFFVCLFVCLFVCFSFLFSNTLQIRNNVTSIEWRRVSLLSDYVLIVIFDRHIST